MKKPGYYDRSALSIALDRSRSLLPFVLVFLAALGVSQLLIKIPSIEHMMVRNVSLGKLWQLWAAGRVPDDTVLWGFPILFWARFGKIAQFAGAMVVIFEIIGPERLRKFGRSLHANFSWQRAEDLLAYAQAWHSKWWSVLLFRPGAGRSYILENYRDIENLRGVAYGLLTTVVIGLWAIKVQSTHHVFYWTVIAALGSLAASILSASVTVGLLALHGLATIVVDVVFIIPIAWFLERKNLEKSVRILSAIAIVVGFHFDLLSS
jgi:hypothetical protein